MGKASSSKKIRKVQQAGVSRAPGQRRNLGYPALVIGIILLGVALVYFAVDHRQASASEKPTPKDHWHEAFGINICGNFQDPLTDAGPDRLGIHTHGDGLIHVHPFGSGASGKNAQLQKFAAQTGLTVTDTSVTLPGGKTYKNGDKCDGKPGTLALYVWPPQANDGTKPKKITKNIATTRFVEDGGAYVLAFLPAGAKVKLPPSVKDLANPSDLNETPKPGDTSGVASTVPASTPQTTAAPATTAPPTTAAGKK